MRNDGRLVTPAGLEPATTGLEILRKSACKPQKTAILDRILQEQPGHSGHSGHILRKV